MLRRLLIKYLFKIDDEVLVMIGSKTQKGSMFAVIQTERLWGKETLRLKLHSILSLKWKPSEDLLQKSAKDVFMRHIFGKKSDYADSLFKLNAWHNSREWDLRDLTENDKIKADALDSMTVLTRMRYRETSDILHLNLFENFPFMCLLTHPMIVKIPVISFQYFLTIHSRFAFNAIRKARHYNSDTLIDYLYEILYLEQKIAISLHELLRLIDYSEREKKEALFINAEINAIMGADLVFSYLKASIEKIVVLIGLTHGINNLDSKPKHKAKLSALREGLPKDLLDIYYIQFMFDFFSSDNLDELNGYRSGLLHKRGISDLQPHNYVGKNADTVPLKKIFQILQEQHIKNTAVLVGALAILTDKLVELDKPEIKLEDIPV